jgi:hypothetical protein
VNLNASTLASMRDAAPGNGQQQQRVARNVGSRHPAREGSEQLVSRRKALALLTDAHTRPAGQQSTTITGPTDRASTVVSADAAARAIAVPQGRDRPVPDAARRANSAAATVGLKVVCSFCRNEPLITGQLVLDTKGRTPSEHPCGVQMKGKD